MLNFKIQSDTAGNTWLETSLSGKPLLTTPQLNKGTAFTREERIEFGLMGKLPAYIETLTEQVHRAYLQFSAYQSHVEKNIYLNSLHNTNQILFYKLVSEHITEMMPIIYTPIVGTAVQNYSHAFRQPRGLYIAYPDREYIEDILDNRSNPEIDLIVVSDGEGVLGIGDQGVGAMDIPIAKLMVYSLCAGIDPSRTLPILLDVGTNNEMLLNDPIYLGWRSRRITGENYDQFIDYFVHAIQQKFPNAFLHWEDFGQQSARRNLDRFKNEICTFNDDLQGTGAVALAALLAAVNVKKERLRDQRIVIFGAGTAGTGIADQICAALCRRDGLHPGLSEKEARERFWLIDKSGLITETMQNLAPGQQIYARKDSDIYHWQCEKPGVISLIDVVKYIRPTILIGCSTLGGAFTQTIVETMANHVERPIIFPLSNPTDRCEATPRDLLLWTHGKALIATGSPFSPVWLDSEDLSPLPKASDQPKGLLKKIIANIKSLLNPTETTPVGGKMFVIAQCNNALVFPGIGLGVLASKARLLSDEMIWAACKTLSECSPIRIDGTAPLLPILEQAQEVAQKIAIAVAKEAQQQGLAENFIENTTHAIEKILWKPHYLPYKKISN